MVGKCELKMTWYFNRKETCEFVVFAMQVFRLGFGWNVNPLTSPLYTSQWISQVESLKLKESFHQSSRHHTSDVKKKAPVDMRVCVCVSGRLIGSGEDN